MSVNAENITHASETMAKISTQTTISPEVFEEKIVANLEPLNEQISTLTQLPNQLIHDNSAKTTPVASFRTLGPQMGPPLNVKIGASKTSPGTELTRRLKF